MNPAITGEVFIGDNSHAIITGGLRAILAPQVCKREVYNRENIIARITQQIEQMNGRELVEFCKTNFSGKNYLFNPLNDTVEFTK